MSSPIVLILGAGARIGQSCAKAFSAAGYRVAIASRSLTHLHTNSSGFLELRIDLSNPEEVPGLFAAVEENLGAPPSVVIYNSASRTVLPPTDPLSGVSIPTLIHDHSVNYLSSAVAAKHAVAGFARLPSSSSRTYIQTGNGLNVFAYPPVVTFGAGKAAAAYLIEGLAKAYKPMGYRFYYADQRTEAGASPLYDVDGEAHASTYVELTGDKEQREWDYTFVKGLGYRAFERDVLQAS